MRSAASVRSAALLPAMVLLLWPVFSQGAEQFCDHSESRLTPSPDGVWVAKVQEEVCTTATGAAAGITVIIEASHDEQRSKRVFIMPVPRSRDDWPRLRWVSAAELELRVANLSEAAPPEPQFEGVHIALAYCNDNPQQRAQLAAYKSAVKQWQKDVGAWVKLRKEDAAAAGTMPPKPVEPVLSAGRCTD